jgi:hypothetical protein
MTLIAGAVIQYTHHYTSLFVWAGLMHPLSLILYFLIVGTKSTEADVSHKKHGIGKLLLVIGFVVAAIGALGIMVTWAKWAHLVEAMKGPSGAAAGVTAAAFVALIGLLLMYAAMDRRSYVPE